MMLDPLKEIARLRTALFRAESQRDFLLGLALGGWTLFIFAVTTNLGAAL